MMLQGCRKAYRAEVVERDRFATPNSLKSQGERNLLSPVSNPCAKTPKLCMPSRPIHPSKNYAALKSGTAAKSPSRPRLRRCPTSRDFVPWRFLDAGRKSASIASSCRHPKTLYGVYWCQGESGDAVESFCHVTRSHLRHGQPLAWLRRAVKPQSRLRRAEGAGLDGECAVRAIIIVAATTYKGHSALFETLWIAIVGTSPFTD